MTVEVITGTPGAGKTCYAVNQRILPESGRTWTVNDPESPWHGQTLTRRVVVAGIRDLIIDHERLPHKLTGEVITEAEIAKWNKMLGDDLPEHQRLPGQPPRDVPCLVQNWWLWCQPGDLIVVDEAQFLLPRGTLGRTPPYFIMAMDIHRHYAVDFLFITQHPNKIATEIRGLCGMHRHIRSVMGSGLCMLYTWDHASNPDRFSLANKSTWWRRSKHYKTYRSAVAHIAPPTSGRSIFWVVPLLLATTGAFAWKVSHRLSAPPTVTAPAPSASSPGSGGGVARMASASPAGWRDVPKLTGCYTHGEKCTCIGEDGWRVNIAPPMCKLSASSFDGLVQWERSKAVRYADPAAPAASSVAPKVL